MNGPSKLQVETRCYLGSANHEGRRNRLRRTRIETIIDAKIGLLLLTGTIILMIHFFN